MREYFFHTYFVQTKRRAWAASILFTICIFGSAPFAPLMVEWLRAHHLLLLFLLGFAVSFFAYLFIYFVCQLKITSPTPYFLILGLLASGLFFMWGPRPLAERIHILEFFILLLLFFKASKFTYKGLWLYLIPLLITVAIGWSDELWQGLLPNRVYDVHDVCNDAVGALIGVGFAWIRQKYGVES